MSEQPGESDSSSEHETPETADVDPPRTDVIERDDPANSPAGKPSVVKVDAPQTDSVEFSEPPDAHMTFDIAPESDRNDP